MADIQKGLTALNGTLTAVNTLLSPGGAVMLVAEGLRAAISRLKARGEETADLEARLAQLEAELDELERNNALYYAIPEKPAELRTGSDASQEAFDPPQA